MLSSYINNSAFFRMDPKWSKYAAEILFCACSFSRVGSENRLEIARVVLTLIVRHKVLYKFL